MAQESGSGIPELSLGTGQLPTRHRRPVRWADSHTAPAPGKVGGFPHGTGARQDGRISTQHRRP
ncbi:hypothetical protein F6029_24080, partial [Salmonella enterica]|nr:hypothetical protein [Salmonella enterica]